MRIGWVGGLNRSEVHLTKIAAASGHELEYHDGDVRGHRADKLRSVVDRSTLVIILTAVNSHNGVQLAKRMARKQNCPAIVKQRCSQIAFREIIAALERDNEPPRLEPFPRCDSGGYHFLRKKEILRGRQLKDDRRT